MKKTAYHKFLERIRHKILGEALEAASNLDHEALDTKPDPSRFQPLEKLYSDPKTVQRLEALTGLFGLESKHKKTGFDVWLAMLLSGQARVPAPRWAVQVFEETGHGRLIDASWTLDKAFGFSAWGNETPEAFARLIHVRHDALFREVWTLTVIGFKVKPACLMVARRYQRDMAKDHALPYRQWRIGQGKKSGLEEVLRKRYNAWLRSNEAVIKRAEREQLIRLRLSSPRKQYLRQYPASSLPKRSRLRKILTRFKKKCSDL